MEIDPLDIEKLKQGDSSEISKFIQKYYSLVLYVVSRKISSYTDAQDYAQEVFLKILEKNSLQKFKGTTEPELRSYTTRIAINFMADLFQKKKIKEDKLDLLDFTEPEHANQFVSPQNIEQEAIQKMEMAELKKAIHRLPHHLRQIMEYRLLGYGNKEIAKILNIPLGTANTWAMRAMEKISRMLKE